MQVRWLGWAGVEIEAAGERLIIDALADPGAVFAWYGGDGMGVPLPEVVPPSPGAIGALITHLHRDHADAGAVRHALGGIGPVYMPGGEAGDSLAVAQAHAELDAAGLQRVPVAAWSERTLGPFEIHALPAVDGTGDPQVSWLVRAEGHSVLHLGDTMFHGWWWRFAEQYGSPDLVCAPVNGAVLNLPHRQPPSPLAAAMGPVEAAVAARVLGARRLLAIHYGGYAIPGVYEPVADPLVALAGEAGGIEVPAPGVGGVVGF